MMEETARTDARDEMVDLMDQMGRKMKIGDARINGWKEDSAWMDFGADGRKMARGWCGAKKSVPEWMDMDRRSGDSGEISQMANRKEGGGCVVWCVQAKERQRGRTSGYSGIEDNLRVIRSRPGTPHKTRRTHLRMTSKESPKCLKHA
jgi:hypothetical protein